MTEIFYVFPALRGENGLLTGNNCKKYMKKFLY